MNLEGSNSINNTLPSKLLTGNVGGRDTVLYYSPALQISGNPVIEWLVYVCIQ